MSQNYQSIVTDIKMKIKHEYIHELTVDTDDFFGIPYPYTIPVKETRSALYYWETYFTNLGLIKMRMVDQARHNVENLVYLLRNIGYVPASNKKSLSLEISLPMLPWMVRDVYRATGDKEWLRRVLPDIIKEYHFWTLKPHTSPTGLYRFAPLSEAFKETIVQDIAVNWAHQPRFQKVEDINPVDLNALLYRNARIIFDLQIETDGHGDQNLLQKSDQMQRLMEICWSNSDGFYYDNDIPAKRLSPKKHLSSFLPLFVEMIDEKRARRMASHLKSFIQPGGLSNGEKSTGQFHSVWEYPYITPPYMYMIIKGLCDYEMMEDAADIGTNWINMVLNIYQETGYFWEWYNVADRTINSPHGLANYPNMGWSVGTFIALHNALGLD